MVLTCTVHIIAQNSPLPLLLEVLCWCCPLLPAAPSASAELRGPPSEAGEFCGATGALAIICK